MRAFVLLALSLVASPALAHPNEEHYLRERLPRPMPVSQQTYQQPMYYPTGYAKQQPLPNVGATACIPITLGNPRYNYAP